MVRSRYSEVRGGAMRVVDVQLLWEAYFRQPSCTGSHHGCAAAKSTMGPAVGVRLVEAALCGWWKVVIVGGNAGGHK